MFDTELIDDAWILSKRGKKNVVDASRPYAWMIEKERTSVGKIEDTGIIFLTNRECPFHCLMCDLWKNTTDDTVKTGAISAQIESVIDNFRGINILKLYNSGSFFDNRAIPEAEYSRIAQLLENFERVIVESHPSFISSKVLKFRDLLKPQLEVAMGLETIKPEVIKVLNKHMDPRDFSRAVKFLRQNQISSRAFILLKTPFMTEEEGIIQAKMAIDYAFEAGVECCTVIPVRAGNGSMEYLIQQGEFSLPYISSLEDVLNYGISLGKGRVFADTWDLQMFSNCNDCLQSRVERITRMNLRQHTEEQILCRCNLKNKHIA